MLRFTPCKPPLLANNRLRKPCDWFMAKDGITDALSPLTMKKIAICVC
jgi:hypothetical protein